MAFNINDFKTNGLVLGGVRSSLFEVELTLPSGVAAVSSGEVSKKIMFTCRASSIPASTVGLIEVPYFGRKIKLSGDRTYSNWSITVINDEDYSVRSAMEGWLNKLNQPEDNLRTIDLATYKTDSLIRSFTKAGGILAEYTFRGMFPLEAAAMEVDWNTTDTLQEFQVTFAYDYWVPVNQLAITSGQLDSLLKESLGNIAGGAAGQ
jgi:hypothetical protein